MSHFGLFRQDDLVFLHEQEGGRCLNPGLSALASPFQGGRLGFICPHVLPHPVEGDIPRGRLVEALGPIQDAGVYQVPTKFSSLIGRMVAMTGPTRPVVSAIWAREPKTLASELLLTNAAPLVVVGLEGRYYEKARRLVDAPRYRNLVIVGDLRLPGVPVLDGAGLDPDTDWRAVGAAQLWRYVNG